MNQCIRFVLIRRSDGKFFRHDCGYWTDQSWTDDLGKAVLYAGISPMKALMTKFRGTYSAIMASQYMSKDPKMQPVNTADYKVQRISVELLPDEEPF